MAASPTVDVRALHAALAAAREAKGLSWRQVAKEIGVSASTISRMANGLKPDLGAFAAMTTWLRMPAERFYIGGGVESAEQPELMAEIAPLLRARKDLTEEDADYLGDLIQAAARRFRAESDARSR